MQYFKKFRLKLFFISYSVIGVLMACEAPRQESDTTKSDSTSTKTETKEVTIDSAKTPSRIVDTTKTINQISEQPSQKVDQTAKKAALPEEIKNTTSIEKKGNTIEFYQKFKEHNQQSEFESQPQDLDLSQTSGGMLSAYSLYKSDYEIYYRVAENGNWQDWKLLSENKEAQNPKRKVFAPQRLEPSVTQIQFKSSTTTENEVVFRIFTFSK